MGKRDYAWKEPKKTKRAAKKTKPISELSPQVEGRGNQEGQKRANGCRITGGSIFRTLP
jgi:hypothetical protein